MHDPTVSIPSSERVTVIGRTVVVKGEIRAGEHLVIDGCVEGHVVAPDHGVTVGPNGCVTQEILARTITVLGRVRGKLTATERVELLASGNAEGRIATTTLIIDEGAYFTGTVDPTLTDTAVAVSQYRLKQRDQRASDPGG